MTVKKFLNEISDEHGPLQTSAADLMERMSEEDFEELMADIKLRTAETWAELMECKDCHPVTLEELDLIN